MVDRVSPRAERTPKNQTNPDFPNAVSGAPSYTDRVRTRIQIFVAILAVLIPRTGTGDAGQELAKLRAAFEADIAKTGEPQMRLYLAQLENLERSLAAEGDYAGAIRARDEAEVVRGQIASLDPSSPPGTDAGDRSELPPKIIFLPKDALTVGTIWDRESDSLYGWRSRNELARWQLPNLPPGGYEVVLEFQAGTSEGGEFIISETFFYLGGQIRPTGAKIEKVNFGTLKIRSGQGPLSLYATRTEPGGLMRLKSIELVPAWR